MQINVLEFLEDNAKRIPEKTAISDETKRISYQQLRFLAGCVGSGLGKRLEKCSPVAFYMEKEADTVVCFLGALYAGCFYTLLNPELPENRLQKMQEVLQAKYLVTDEKNREKAAQIFPDMTILTAQQLFAEQIDEELLAQRRREATDTDPVYLNFTSGSTGTPKGIVVAHRSILDFIDCFTGIFDITERDVIANQAPFDFDVSVKDIYSALKTGAELVIVPRRMFSLPTELLDFLCNRKITTMIWAVSALCLITTLHGLDYKTPESIQKVLFSGEVMPEKHLRNWRSHLPNAMFVNLYGPTEITCNCTYHILRKECGYENGIPIGKPFPNEDVFLLDENNQKITAENTVGEICVRGTALALGYYKNPEQNAAHFVQNPLNPFYPERIYRTGDLGRIADNGEFVFCGRKDFQIKYMGHRIELEEVERAMSAIDGVERCCCIFDEAKSKLKGYYVGTIEKNELHERMTATLPVFMVPGMLRRVEEMPLTKNGKIDRKKLEEAAGGK